MKRSLATTTMDPTTAWEPFTPTPEQPWNTRRAAHLLRRAAFGGTPVEIRAAQKQGMQPTVDALLEAAHHDAMDQEMDRSGRLVAGGADARLLAAWWLLRMVKTTSPLLEKMTLFWHGHFATGAEKVAHSRAMLRQNQRLRANALGRFPTLVKEISSDVAMLIYLDSEENRRTRPNENYARELMELFCLGPGHYTEKDIKEIARCFTGWTVRRNQFRFDPHQHDPKRKSFLGAAGNFDGNDAIDVVLKQPAAARFIAKKLIRFFVFDDEPISDPLAEPIAQVLRDSDFQIEEGVRTILASRIFYSDQAIGKKIKSPVELAVGFLRFFNASTHMNDLGTRLARLGQLPFYPPNVKGWPGGRSWINASTVLARANLIQHLVEDSERTKLAAGSFEQWFRANVPGESLEGEIDFLDEYLLAEPLAPSLKTELITLSQTSDCGVRKRLAWLAAFPEFQLN